MQQTCLLLQRHYQLTCCGTAGSRLHTCVDVSHGARRSAPTQQCKEHTGAGRALTAAARQTVTAGSVTGIHDMKPAAFGLSRMNESSEELYLLDRIRLPVSVAE